MTTSAVDILSSLRALARHSASRAVASHAARLREAADRISLVAVDDPDLVAFRAQRRLEELDRLDCTRLDAALLELGQPRADRAAHQRVQDRLQVAQRGGVAEHDLRPSSEASNVPKRLRMAARASASFWRISRVTRSASMVATPRSRSIPATVLLPQPMLPVSPMTFMPRSMVAPAGSAGRSGCCAGRPRSARSAGRIGSRAARSADRPPAARRWPRLAVGPHVVAEARPAVGDPLAQDLPDRPMQSPHVLRLEGVRGAQRVEPRPPQGLVGVDVADPGDERLVEQQRLQLRRSPLEALGEPLHG